MTAVAVILSNYFHDVASATLLGSGVLLALLERKARAGGEAQARALARAYPSLRRFAYSVGVWLAAGAVLRAIYYTHPEWGEWTQAVRNGLAGALLAKHALMVVALVAGVWLWVSFGRRARAILGLPDQQG